MNLKALIFPYFFSIPRSIANPSIMFGTPSHGLTNMLEGSVPVSTFPLRLCSFLENLGGMYGFVARARLLHSALHKEEGDAVRPREVIIGRGMRGVGWSCRRKWG